MEHDQRFPIGASISLAALSEDPYRIYKQLQASEPITWCTATNMYLVTRHSDVRELLRDTHHFIAGTDHSLVMDTFGSHMLTTEGELHDSYKLPLLPLFRVARLRERVESDITRHARDLIAGFKHKGGGDLRELFACRLPVLGMLALFGLPATHERIFRHWYNAFERALSNFSWDEDVRREAKASVREFHDYLQVQIERKRLAPDQSLLSQMLQFDSPRPLTDEEIRRNISIIFFGGISTVEALILNSFYILTEREDLVARLISEPAETITFLDEVVRWSGPVQSATRHVAQETELLGVQLQPGDTVNCMIAAANRDARVFDNPDVFDMDRPNLRSHVGFAIGSHHCLGSHLAKLEASIAVQELLRDCPKLARNPAAKCSLSGFEFRQPAQLEITW